MSKLYILVILVLIAGYGLAYEIPNAIQYINLGGNDWQFSSSNGSLSGRAIVPGNIISDLRAAGVIGDPLAAFNDINYRWVSYENWTFSKKFNVAQAFLDSASEVVLDLEGIDTVASIYLNQKLVAQVSNQFVAYLLPVKSLLQAGSNSIIISFVATPIAANHAASVYPYPVPESDNDSSSIGNRNMIRRAAVSWGWDFGPAFLPVAIWKPVRLIPIATAVLLEATPMVSRDDQTWTVDTAVQIYAAPSSSSSSSSGLTAELALDLGYQGSSSKRVLLHPGLNTLHLSLEVDVDSIMPWWPRGYGTASLYDLNIKLSINGENQSLNRPIGFRTIELITTPLQNGSEFYFKINGLPIFSKGANLVPIDLFHDKATSNKVLDILQSAVDANMNMIRVWGGGIYQDDLLYSFADEKGLLIWQEFMFGCAMYPRDEDFLTSVEEEVEYQVRRIGWHPSIAIWGGNNENEAALNWYPLTKLHRDRYLVDQVALYVDTIRRKLKEIDSVRPYVWSSPSNGPLSEDPFVLRFGNPQDPSMGDVHYYNYEDDCLDESLLPKSRFVSEFGWNSFPSLYAWSSVTSDPKQLELSSPLMKQRLHKEGAITNILKGASRHYKNVSTSKGPAYKFRLYSYQSQVLQAVCDSFQIETYRKNRDVASIHTMGALYWQLNDVWQALTWSSLEYGGRWKMKHYAVKRSFADVILFTRIDKKKNLQASIISDLPQDIDAEVTLNLFDLRTSELVFSKNFTASLTSLGSVSVFTMPTSTLLCSGKTCLPPEAAVATFTMMATCGCSVKAGARNEFFTELKDALLPSHPTIKAVSATLTNPNQILVTLVSDAVAAHVFVETSYDGRWSDNDILLIGNSPIELTFFAKSEVTPQALLASLQFTSIVDTYNTA